MPEPTMDSRATSPMPPSRSWFRLAIAALFAGGLIAFFLLGGEEYLTLEALRDNRDALLNYTRGHYPQAIVLALLIYTAATALGFPSATVLSLAIGFLFGRWLGTLIILIAATLGATLLFLAARYLFADAMRSKLHGALATRLINGFNDDAFNYLLFLRLVPIFPFWLVNLAPAFTAIKLRTYVIGTAIGILPGCFVFANLGQSLGRIDSLQQLLSAETLLALGLLGVLALLPVMMKKFRKQTNEDHE